MYLQNVFSTLYEHLDNFPDDDVDPNSVVYVHDCIKYIFIIVMILVAFL